jgi:hypothetical protein
MEEHCHPFRLQVLLPQSSLHHTSMGRLPHRTILLPRW